MHEVGKYHSCDGRRHTSQLRFGRSHSKKEKNTRFEKNRKRGKTRVLYLISVGRCSVGRDRNECKPGLERRRHLIPQILTTASPPFPPLSPLPPPFHHRTRLPEIPLSPGNPRTSFTYDAYAASETLSELAAGLNAGSAGAGGGSSSAGAGPILEEDRYNPTPPSTASTTRDPHSAHHNAHFVGSIPGDTLLHTANSIGNRERAATPGSGIHRFSLRRPVCLV